MAAVVITPTDLEPFATIAEAKAIAMIEDAMAMAARVAPCITDDDFEFDAAAKAIIRGAILRWNEAGTGALVQQSAGPFATTTDNRQARRSMFWPSEIADLAALCSGENTSGAFSVDTACASYTLVHADSCALNFGALYCSCGAVLTYGLPLYG